MFAAGRDAVPWTKPDELPFAAGKPLPALDNTDEKGVLVGIADGSVRYIPGRDQALLRKLITRAGREVVAWPPAPQIRGIRSRRLAPPGRPCRPRPPPRQRRRPSRPAPPRRRSRPIWTIGSAGSKTSSTGSSGSSTPRAKGPRSVGRTLGSG